VGGGAAGAEATAGARWLEFRVAMASNTSSNFAVIELRLAATSALVLRDKSWASSLVVRMLSCTCASTAACACTISVSAPSFSVHPATAVDNSLTVTRRSPSEG